MKRKNVVIVLGLICVVMFTVVFALELVRAVSERARDVQANDVCSKLAIEIKYFQIQNGRFPHSLSELQSTDSLGEADKNVVQELMAFAQHNKWHDTYDYVPSTNGFTLVVTGPSAGWLGKGRRMEKHYNAEDVR
ncbi:MAG: hypothetical protein DME21_02970 [Verrucomicrobia bacterium]|nr:MAG: hypothetical protein DME21_02970 [Verrucomicrobiota bacterium]